MSRSFGEPLEKLRAVPIRENGEPLVDPRRLSRRIHFAAVHPKFPEMKRTARVRRRVAQMLAEGADSLPDRIDLQIIEGFRPLSQQAFMYEALMRELAQEHPEWDEATLHRMTNRLSAPPDDPCPPPHSTGGAVDVRLVRMPRRQPLDLSSPYATEDKESAPTEVKGLTPEARANRCLLIRTLEATGLTNYAGEWWHWSYGDSGWALRTGAPYVLYDRIAAA